MASAEAGMESVLYLRLPIYPVREISVCETSLKNPLCEGIFPFAGDFFRKMPLRTSAVFQSWSRKEQKPDLFPVIITDGVEMKPLKPEVGIHSGFSG